MFQKIKIQQQLFFFSLYVHRLIKELILLMGGCVEGSSSEPPKTLEGSSVVTYPQKGKSYKKIFSEQTQKLYSSLIDHFCIIQRLRQKMNTISYTESSLNELLKPIWSLLEEYSLPQTNEQKILINNLFTPDVQKEITKANCFYQDLLKSFAKTTSQPIKKTCSSRIYNLLANRVTALKQLYNLKYTNYSDVSAQKKNDFKLLTPQQIEEIVVLQSIGDSVQLLGDTLYFHQIAMERESEEISMLLKNIFTQFKDQIQRLSYDLSVNDIGSISKISRRACDYHEDGIYLILVYFTKSCKKLQAKGEDLQTIEGKLKVAVQWVSKQYPPGTGLNNCSEDLKKQLQKMEHKQTFQNKKYTFDAQQTDKKKALEDIIIENAKIAYKNKADFERIIKEACIKRAVAFKIGLKYYPDHPNPKAIIRIFEKLLFKNTGERKQTKAKKIAEALSLEEEAYVQTLKQSLSKLQSVTFTISDMVRGKCVFLGIQDIIDTVNDIKAFVASEGSKYRIVEIQSRFNKPIPISDVTLKIAINEQIVAQLQLTLQTNLATYNFAHKIYELQRAKLFSKVKIVHNYYEQYTKQISQLILGQLSNTHSTQQKPRTLQNQMLIKDFFELSNKTLQSFDQLLKNSIETTQLWKKVNKDNICLQEDKQDFILPIIYKKQRLQQSIIGQIINVALTKQNHTPLYKSMVVYYLLIGFNCQSEFERIVKFSNIYLNMNKKPKFSQFEEYIGQYFKVTWRINEHQPAKIYHLFQHLQNLVYVVTQHRGNGGAEYILDLVRGQKCIPAIKEQLQYATIFFRLAKYDKLDAYYKNILYLKDTLLDPQDKIKGRNLAAQMQLLMVQKYLITNEIDKAKLLLQNNQKLYKQAQLSFKAAQCDLLLVQCELKLNNNVDKAEQEYQKMKESTVINGVSLKGPIVADCELRIGKKMLQIIKTTNNESKIPIVFKSHISQAFIHLVSIKSIEWILKTFSQYWYQFEQKSIQWPAVQDKKTPRIYLSFQSLGSGMCGIISKIKWIKLEEINLSSIQAAKQGSLYLSQTTCLNLQKLFLYGNKIGSEGCKSIVKGNWPSLKQIYLAQNQIDSIGCEHLSKGNWPQLQSLRIQRNKIKKEGCQFLIQGVWPNLNWFTLSYNQINDAACQLLSKANWPRLEGFNLGWNNIRDKGCVFLCSSNWPLLKRANLQYNKIEEVGCEAIVKANWPNLTDLSLQSNLIGQIGCEYLSKSSWPQLDTININKNYIRNKGLQHLSSCKWPKLKTVFVGQNEIGRQGMEYLSKADWPLLESIIANLNSIQKSQRNQIKKLFKNQNISIRWE